MPLSNDENYGSAYQKRLHGAKPGVKGGDGDAHRAGESGRDKPIRYMPGQRVHCTVIEPAEHGYRVAIARTGQIAYLHTHLIMENDTELMAQFICRRDGQVFLGPLPSSNTKRNSRQ